MDGHTLVKVTSRRARERLAKLMRSDMPQSHFSWTREGTFYWLPDSQAKAALKLPGIAEAPDKNDLERHLPL